MNHTSGFHIIPCLRARAKRSYPTSEVRGSGQECQATTAQDWLRGATQCPRSGAAAGRSNPTPEARGSGWEDQPRILGSWLRGHRRAQGSYPMLKVRKRDGEEIPLVQGKEQRLHFAGVAMKIYPTPKVRETQVRWQVLQEGIRGQTH